MKERFFTRKVKLTFPKMMSLILKKSTKSIQNSLNDMQLEMRKMNPKENYSITNSAYTQARAKLSYTAFDELSEKTVELFYRDGEYHKYKGFRLLAIDGSIVILPNSEDIKKEFNPIIAKCGKKGYSKEVIQSRVSVLYDVLNNIAIDASINNQILDKTNPKLKAKDERSLALEHLEYCNKKDLVICDRGYPSYKLFVKYGLKSNFLMRIQKSTSLEAKLLFNANNKEKDIVVEIKAPSRIKAELKQLKLPIKMKIRFIQVILNDGTVEVLATNILSKKILKTEDFKELYAKRWGIETYYDVLKNRLSLENFTGKTALAIRQDFHATIFLTNYESMLVYDSNLELLDKSKSNNYAQKVNKAVSFNAIKHEAFNIFYGSEDLATQMEQLKELFLMNTVLVRPNRKTPPRLDKSKYSSSIAHKAVQFLKRKKKSVGN